MEERGNGRSGSRRDPWPELDVMIPHSSVRRAGREREYTPEEYGEAAYGTEEYGAEEYDWTGYDRSERSAAQYSAAKRDRRQYRAERAARGRRQYRAERAERHRIEYEDYDDGEQSAGTRRGSSPKEKRRDAGRSAYRSQAAGGQSRSGYRGQVSGRRRRALTPAFAFGLTFALVMLIGVTLLGVYGLVQSADRRAAGEDTVHAVLAEVIPILAPSEEAAHQIEETLWGEEQEIGEATASDNITKLEDGTYRVAPASQENATFAFAGDILFDERYAIGASVNLRGGSIVSSFDEAALDVMRSADVFMVNNEFPYTSRGEPLADKQFTFRADPSTASWLTEMGVDIVSLANNHCYDYGEVGLLDTLDTLDQMKMIRVGAGRNLEEAMAPAYFRVGEMTIAVINSTQIERLDNPDTRGATETSAGVFRCFVQDQLLEVIGNAAENADYVIVYIHWGTENETQPDWLQFDRIDDMAAAGADLIVGDHSHCLQPVTYTGDTAVIYSLGNYLFTSYTVDTGILQATFDPQEKTLSSLRFVPMLQQDSSVKTLTGSEKERVLQKLRDISPGVSIDSDGYITKQ
ncbi:MAG: CapA family protein [Eubacteriales bacterium]|nr:CapA family protein [Eubacteriales bacterium]